MRFTDAAMLLFALFLAWSFYRAHRDPGSEINAFDLVMVDGRLSRLACVFVGAFIATTWLMIRLVLDGKMTEGYMGLYGAMWVAPTIARLFSTPPPPSSTAQEIK